MAGFLHLCVLATVISACCSVPLSWEELAVTGLARNRWFGGSAFFNGRLFIFGGQGNRQGTNDTGVLDDTLFVNIGAGETTWRQLSTSEAPSPRYGFVSGVFENYWIISHGCDITTCFSDTWAMDLSLDTPDWFLLVNSTGYPDPLPRARLTVAGGVFPGADQFWLSMGEEASGRKLSDTWVLEINRTDDGIAGTWREVSPGGGLNQYQPFLPSARSLHTGTPINTTTFAIFGGCASGGQVGGPCPLGDSWILDSETGVWESFATCVTPAVRASMIMVPTQPGRAFIMQGSRNYSPGVFPQLIIPANETASAEVYVMSDGGMIGNSTSWKRVEVVGGDFPSGREGAFVAVDTAGGVVYLIGGRMIEESLYLLDVWRLSGDGDADVDEGCPAPLLSFVHLHGIFMYLAWGLMLPLGALLGRYYRWTWPCWFILHILCQSGGVLFTVAGFVVIFLVGSFSSPDFPHAIIGIILTFLLIQQFLSGIFHPCVNKENGKTPPNEKSGYRKCWEVYHGASGFISIAVGLGQLMLGVLLVGAPVVVWGLWAGLGGLWIITFLLHEMVYICYNLAHKVRRKRIY